MTEAARSGRFVARVVRGARRVRVGVATLRGMSPRQPERLLPCGTILSDTYRLERLLARGGMGAVYLARDLVLERAVAVKVLLPSLAADSRIAELFRHEAIAIASVRHANLVQVLTAGEHGALPYFVMEYVPGQTVAELIRASYRLGHGVSLGEVREILHQAAEGLSALHARGLFHGDVKPANMLIDAARHVEISDFGLVGSGRKRAAGVNAETEGVIRYGTPLYVAPELICGADVLPEKRHLCDVYSLGASVFEMFTGQGPFVGATIRDILRGHLFTTPPRVSDLRPDLPLEVDEIVARALEKNPRLRFQRCTQLSAEIDGLAQLAA